MNDAANVKLAQTSGVLCLALAALLLSGCPNVPPTPRNAFPTSQLRPLDLSGADLPTSAPTTIQLRAARNEWTSFTLSVDRVTASHPLRLRVSGSSSSADPLGPANLTAYQVLPMPVEINPGYVRHTGLNRANRTIARALLPLALENGTVNLAAVRDPKQPANPAAHPNDSTLAIWIDLHIPASAAAGKYSGWCDLVDSTGHSSGASVPVELTVYDFALPDQRHLQMVGQLNWDRLAALYPAQFGDTITPSLINRRESRYEQTVATLDRLMVQSEQNRAGIAVPGLRPTVKWPAGEPPQIDWSEFDPLISPWMSGQIFADHMPIRYWPLPAAQSLDRFDSKSRLDYWSLASTHFDQLGWLDEAAILLRPVTTDAVGADAASDLCTQAAQILATNPKVKVMLPLEYRQIIAAARIKPQDMDRVLTAARALVSDAQPPAIVAEERLHRHWLRTDLPGLLPFAGAGDERDVRVWAWLAFLRGADLILWDHPLPAEDRPDIPADPNAMTWFYPGSWFGTDQPVPTIQLKWLRRAQQDYEYLWLAEQRGEVINATVMARLITKPVEILPGQSADPAYSLMSGTTSEKAWDELQELMARTILLRRPGETSDPKKEESLNIQTLQWAQPQERPMLMARSATWALGGPRLDRLGKPQGNWIDLHLGIDIYNASDQPQEKNQLAWTPPAERSGWEVRPQPIDVPPLQTYHVQPATMPASFDLNQLSPEAARPMGIGFVDGYNNKQQSRLKVRLPVAATDRREGPISLDGKLDDWTDADAIQNGPLVLMLDRPDLQNQQLRFAPVNSRIYSCWGRETFYLAFALEGLSPDPHQAHNDIHYQARRAWGEDLCEVLVQPVYSDNSMGPISHIAFKPNGAQWVERKEPDKPSADEWRPIEGAGVRYATTTAADGRWHGEAAIPWRLIGPADRGLPVLLRFNFCQHRHATCQSASWCGPVDFGRDEQLMGVLYVRTPRDLGGAANAAAWPAH